MMQHQYALAEGAEYRPVRWSETSGEHKEFPSSMDLFKFAADEGWEFVTVIPSGKTGNYRQYYFKRASE
ncbi:MAG: hypothetical protein ACO1SV_04345 [Fimbriimonas sp.]